MSQYCVDKVMESYRNLASDDIEERQAANNYLLTLIDREEAWEISNKMIVESTDLNFQFLGAHILYQKIQSDLSQLPPQFKLHLKQFIIHQLNGGSTDNITTTTPRPLKATVDKLASSFALISIPLIVEYNINPNHNHHPQLITEIVQFMQQSQQNLKTGLVILERLPQQLKAATRITHGAKLQIQQQLLNSSDLLAQIFYSALQMNQQQTTLRAMTTMESWIKFNFPLMKYNTLVELLLKSSVISLERLEVSSKVVGETLRQTAQGKFMTLSEVDPLKEMAAYGEEEITSFKSIVSYLFLNQAQFMQSTQISEIYTSMVCTVLLNYGFLLLEEIGMKMIRIVQVMLASPDLKLSESTFEFWNDFSEKTAKMTFPPAINQSMWVVFQEVLSIILEKTMCKDEMMEDPEIKMDDTVDDTTSISFNEYRKEAETLLKFLYDYFHKKRGEVGITVFFQKLQFLLHQDQGLITGGGAYGKHIELALYGLKAAIQSMVHPYEGEKIAEFITATLTVLQIAKQKYGHLPPRVAAQTMNLMKDCTKEIKDYPELFLSCMRFALTYITDEQLCHHSAYCFSSLTQSIKQISNHPGTNTTGTNFLPSLLQFYNSHYQCFTKQAILERMLEGVFAAVSKSKSQTIGLINSIEDRARKILQLGQQQSLKQCLIELKTMLDCYQSADKQFKQSFKPSFSSLASTSLVLSTAIITMSLSMNTSSNTIPSPSSVTGLSLQLIKNGLKFYDSLTTQQLSSLQLTQIMNILQLSMSDPIILNLKSNWVYSALASDILDIFSRNTTSSSSLTNTTINNSHFKNIGEFLCTNIDKINNQYMKIFQTTTSIDPDILKTFLSLQSSIILFNPQIYLHYQHHQHIFQLAVMSLKNVNERMSQRKASNYILLCTGLGCYSHIYLQLTQGIFNCIPVINSGCYITLCRIIIGITSGIPTSNKEQLFTMLCKEVICKNSKNSKNNQSPPPILPIIVKQFVFGIQSGVIRYLKLSISTLAETANHKGSPDSALQAELQLTTWKKQYNKVIKNGGKVINGQLMT